MEIFYLIVLVIATAILILILTFVGLIMQRGKKNLVYPPMANTCPDNWTVLADGSCNIPTTTSSNSNLGNNPITWPSGFTPPPVGNFDPNDSKWTTSGKTAVCAQNAWANQNNILWDGVSNYNSCK